MGTIIGTALNCPGSFGDGKVIHAMHLDKMMAYLPPGLWIAGDSTVCSTPRCRRPLTDTELAALGTAGARQLAQTIGSLVSSVRVASEWGIGGMKNCCTSFNIDT